MFCCGMGFVEVELFDVVIVSEMLFSSYERVINLLGLIWFWLVNGK